LYYFYTHYPRLAATSFTTNKKLTIFNIFLDFSSAKPDIASNPREKRQLRIRQGLAFLQ